MPGGRPSKYQPNYCEMLIEHMSTGLSYECFAGDLSVSKDTLYEWEKVHPEFSDAKRIGIEKCRKFWEKLGIAGAAGKIKNFSAAAYIFNMKNRFAWRDQVQLSVAEDSAPLVLKYNV